MRARQHTVIALIMGLVAMGHAAFAACLGDANSGKVYTFDVVPQLTAAKIYTTWSPLLPVSYTHLTLPTICSV